MQLSLRACIQQCNIYTRALMCMCVAEFFYSIEDYITYTHAQWTLHIKIKRNPESPMLYLRHLIHSTVVTICRRAMRLRCWVLWLMMTMLASATNHMRAYASHVLGKWQPWPSLILQRTILQDWQFEGHCNWLDTLHDRLHSICSDVSVAIYVPSRRWSPHYIMLSSELGLICGRMYNWWCYVLAGAILKI